jgi:maltose O-acetyltransferase
MTGMQLVIEKAQPFEHSILTEIAFAAKRHWNYPEDHYESWKSELTITSDYINRNMVYSAKQENRWIGFYSIVENPADLYSGDVLISKGFWLDHMFILPEFHHLGIGRNMIHHLQQNAPAHGIEKLLIFVEPFAQGFYEKIGAEYLHMAKSSIPGRLIPVYEMKIRQSPT